MWVADMDFPVAEPIRDAIMRRASHPIYGYTARPDSYYGAIIDWMRRRHGWEVKREWITHSNGVINALYTAVLALSETGDGVIIQPPVYHPFPAIIRKTGRRVVENPLKVADGHYAPDIDDLIAKIRAEKPKLLILCNPHNPVGRVFTRGELEAIGRACVDNGIIVLSDEIHGDLVYREYRHVPFASISEDFARTSVICTAPSKTFNLAGLATSNIIIPDEGLRSRFDRANEGVGAKTFNLFGSVACEAAYAHGESWLETVIDYIDGNRRFATDFLKDRLPEFRVTRPEGTYFLWIDLSALNLGQKELERFLLRDAGLWFNQGYTFGEGGDGFVRVNIACRRATVEEALLRLESAVRALRQLSCVRFP
jgi:cystathionine beta-lyase